MRLGLSLRKRFHKVSGSYYIVFYSLFVMKVKRLECNMDKFCIIRVLFIERRIM